MVKVKVTSNSNKNVGFDFPSGDWDVDEWSGLEDSAQSKNVVKDKKEDGKHLATITTTQAAIGSTQFPILTPPPQKTFHAFNKNDNPLVTKPSDAKRPTSLASGMHGVVAPASNKPLAAHHQPFQQLQPLRSQAKVVVPVDDFWTSFNVSDTPEVSVVKTPVASAPKSLGAQSLKDILAAQKKPHPKTQSGDLTDLF